VAVNYLQEIIAGILSLTEENQEIRICAHRDFSVCFTDVGGHTVRTALRSRREENRNGTGEIRSWFTLQCDELSCQKENSLVKL